MWSATLFKNADGVKTKSVKGRTLKEIETKAEAFGAIRIQFMTGEVWRKLQNEWVIMPSKRR